MSSDPSASAPSPPPSSSTSAAREAPGADWHSVTVQIPFASPKHALIAKRVIEVDPELQPRAVKRVLEVEGDKLVATFHTLTVRLARLTLNAFLENVDLVVRTIENFGEEAERGLEVVQDSEELTTRTEARIPKSTA